MNIYDLLEPIRTGHLTIDGFVGSLSDDEATALVGAWDLWRLPHQTPPTDDYLVWLMYSGRGGGKTHGAAAQCHEWSKDKSNFRGGYGLLAGKTYDDVREYQIEGKSGLLATAPPGFKPDWYPGKQLLIYPNGVKWIIATGDKPDSFHGPTVAKAWLDELARWKKPRECWDAFMPSLREGPNPQAVVSTTPSRDPIIAELEDLALDPDEPDYVITRASSTSNPHLHGKALAQLQRRYGGTRLGKEQLEGQVLRDHRGALLILDTIHRYRVGSLPHLDTIVVSVDPVGSDDSEKTPSSDNKNEVREAGIIVAGIGPSPYPPDATVLQRKHAYVLEDCSLAGGSNVWGERAVDAYKRWHADKVIGETNYGGDMVRGTIHAVDPNVPFQMVTASRGKRLRAEPVGALYEQGVVHHLNELSKLEDQWTSWVPGKSTWSPDRLDAVVHALTNLMLDDVEEEYDPWNTYA